jgi:magnesium-protoporphyrin O-methyltransferase
VPPCCHSKGCDEFFDQRFARRMANRYRRRGLDRTARRMVAFLEERGLEGATVLEIGGGVGEIQLELLKRGATRTLNLELSASYDEEARRLLREAGFEGRVERRLTDIATQPGEVGPADVVVLNRVVCCYPDYERLLGAVADHARRLVVFSYPPSNVVSRALVAFGNVLFHLRGRDFRLFTHPPAAMLAVVEEQGFRRTFAHRALVWRAAGLERAT